MPLILTGIFLTIIFFSIRGIISLIIILWVGKKVKKYLDKKKEKSQQNTSE